MPNRLCDRMARCRATEGIARFRPPAPHRLELSSNILYKAWLPSRFEMRVRLTLAVFVGLLFCSLVCLEATELARLADDTSNDFSAPYSTPEISSAIVRKSFVIQLRALPARIERCRSGGQPVESVSHSTARDLLHQFCIQRI
jgi:hypothetical protein